MSTIDLSRLVTAEQKQQTRRMQAYAALAALRWQHETGGLHLADGTRIATTRESQAQIASVLQSLNAGLIDGPIDWKTETGWIQLSAAQISSVAASVARHVKACFAAERAVMAELDATGGDLGNIDLQAAFGTALQAPQN